MRHTVFLSALLSCVAISGPDALAQDCGQVLQQGIWESHDASSNSLQSNSFANWACSSGSSRLSGSYLGNYGDFKGSKEDDSSSCSSSSGSWKIEQQQIERTSTAAQGVIQAWSHCIESLGTHATILYREDMSVFTINLEVRGVKNNKGRAVLRPLEPANIACNEKLGEDHVIEFNLSKTISCSRSTTDAVTIDVEYPDGYGGQSLYVRGYKPPAVLPPRPAIISVEVPVDSSDGNSFPLRDHKWRATFPTQLEQGIAFILDPDEFQILPGQFAIHDHHMVNGDPRQPLPMRANVTYVFDSPAEIAGVEVVQHTNGITGIDGFYGSSPETLAPMGDAWSFVVGDRAGGSIFPDPGRDLFLFEKPRTASVFRIVIKKVSAGGGYALYRIYPVDSHLQRYLGKN